MLGNIRNAIGFTTHVISKGHVLSRALWVIMSSRVSMVTTYKSDLSHIRASTRIKEHTEGDLHRPTSSEGTGEEWQSDRRRKCVERNGREKREETSVRKRFSSGCPRGIAPVPSLTYMI
jgi:hypothetical protein